jgi:hypothetical protein
VKLDAYTALMQAAINGHADVVNTLIKAGASLAFQNKWRKNAIDLATMEGHTKTAHLLRLEQKRLEALDIEQTLFYYAVKEGDLKKIQELLAAGSIDQ